MVTQLLVSTKIMVQHQRATMIHLLLFPDAFKKTALKKQTLPYLAQTVKRLHKKFQAKPVNQHCHPGISGILSATVFSRLMKQTEA